MTQFTNIVRRQNSRSLYVRAAVPKHLQGKLRKKEFWQSLRTPDMAEAKRRARRVLDVWEAQWRALDNPASLTEGELQNLVWNRYVALLARDEKFRQGLPSAEDLDAIWAELEREFGEYDIGAFRIFELIRDMAEKDRAERIKRLAALRKEAAVGGLATIRDAVADAIAARQLDVAEGDGDWRKIGHALTRAEIEGLQRTVERDAGDFGGAPRDPIVKEPTIRDDPRERVMVLYDAFKRDREGDATADTWSQNRKIVELLDSYLGGDAHVSKLTRKAVRGWKDELFKWPRRAADTKIFKGKSFADVIAINATAGKPVLGRSTINKYLSAVGSFGSWLQANDHVAEDITTGLFLAKDREQKRFPFSVKQVASILAAPLFGKCGGDKAEHVAGEVKVRDWRYWIPLIALYSGARLGEIAQLLTADVRRIHDVWCFVITKEGSALKSVKTRGSERIVPVHSRLIELGFIKYHAAKVKAGSVQLFPELKPDARGYWSGIPSKFFGGFFKDIGVKADATQAFHSIRHSVADAFRRGGYMDEQFGPSLLGHGKATTTARYGVIPQGILSDRVKMIEAVKYVEWAL